ncbi:MAG: hypothetical protein R2912_12315 [Eubacteriales bacterium]
MPSARNAATSAAQGAADAVSAQLSGAVAEAATQVTETITKLPGIFQWVVDHKPRAMAALVKAPKFMVWIHESLGHAPIEVPVQIMMVIMEILIGLAFMGDSVHLPDGADQHRHDCCNCVDRHGGLITMMWYFFGAIAILMGAGRTRFVSTTMSSISSRSTGCRTKLAGKSYLYYDHSDDE